MVAPFSKIYDLRFQYFNFETDFLENEYLFQKKALSLKKHHFHTKLLYEKPMLRQIEWWVQNGPITKNRVLPVTNSFFWKFCFSLRNSYKELIWCTNHSNAHIPTFWSFIWRCFFPVSLSMILIEKILVKKEGHKRSSLCSTPEKNCKLCGLRLPKL